MVRTKVLKTALAGVVLLATAVAADAQSGRPVAPYSSEAAWLQAEKRKLDAGATRLTSVKERFETMVKDLSETVTDFKRRWDANERLGQTYFRGDAHTRAHRKYWDTRDSLERERKLLKLQSERLQQASRSLQGELRSYNEAVRVYNERRAAYGRNNPGSGNSSLFFDDNAPKGRR
jgi:chromosome segregation ATPase